MGHHYFACRRCQRRGRYSDKTLEAQFGPDWFNMERLPQAVAKWRECPMVGVIDAWGRSACGIHLDLASKVMADKRAREGRGRR